MRDADPAGRLASERVGRPARWLAFRPADRPGGGAAPALLRVRAGVGLRTVRAPPAGPYHLVTA